MQQKHKNQDDMKKKKIYIYIKGGQIKSGTCLVRWLYI